VLRLILLARKEAPTKSCPRFKKKSKQKDKTLTASFLETPQRQLRLSYLLSFILCVTIQNASCHNNRKNCHVTSYKRDIVAKKVETLHLSLIIIIIKL